MIDWITAQVNVTHTPINAGQVVSVKPNGDIEWLVEKTMSVEGSYSSRMTIKTVGQYNGAGMVLRIDGNPIKFLQGHNLFGSDDLVGLVYAVIQKLAPIAFLRPTDIEMAHIKKGLFELFRVDCTAMFELPCRADVRSWLYAVEHQARHRMGRPINSGGTVYFGKHSRRWAIKFYSKGDEIEVKKKGHQLPEELLHRDDLIAWADNKLRAELVLRSMELKDHGLNVGSSWLNIEKPLELLQSFSDRLKMSDQFNLSATTIADLPARLMAVYELWKAGKDLKTFYPARSYYRYRSELLKHGIDISIRQTPHKDENVIPLVRALRPEAISQVPQWAINTPLFFQPVKRHA